MHRHAHADTRIYCVCLSVCRCVCIYVHVCASHMCMSPYVCVHMHRHAQRHIQSKTSSQDSMIHYCMRYHDSLCRAMYISDKSFIQRKWSWPWRNCSWTQKPTSLFHRAHAAHILMCVKLHEFFFSPTQKTWDADAPLHCPWWLNSLGKICGIFHCSWYSMCNWRPFPHTS